MASRSRAKVPVPARVGYASPGCSVCGVVYEGRSLGPDFHELAYGRTIFADVDGVSYCLVCWKRAGRPWPRRVTLVES